MKSRTMTSSTKLAVVAALCSAAALTACSDQSGAPSSGGSSGGSSSNSGGSSGAQGGGGTGQNDVATISTAYSKTLGAKTASFTTHTETMQGGKSVQTDGSGTVQFDPPAADYTVRVLGRPAEIRLVDGNVFVNTNGKWTKAPAGQLSQLSNSSPAQSLELLKNSVSEAKKIGTKQVNNMQVTGYHVTLDITKLINSASNDALKKSMQSLQNQLKSNTLPVDIYLDDQGRVVEQDQTLNIQVQNQQVSSKTVSTYTAFGKPVNIKAPTVG